MTPTEVITDLGLQLDATFVPRSVALAADKTDRDVLKLHEEQIHWSVRIYSEKGSAELTTKYHQGIGHLPKSLKMRDFARVTVDEKLRIMETLETGKVAQGFSRSPLPAPSIEDVLYCLVSDADAIDSAGFEDWAGDHGYDEDSRSAEKIYQACLQTGLTLRRMLGDAGLQRLREAFQDY